jgi:hypothetical protein
MSTVLSTPTTPRTSGVALTAPDQKTSAISGVSWGAIFAGAAGAAALSLILLLLGTGLGLSSVSPWIGQGAGAATFGTSTIVWLTFTQLAASGMGGYLAGRLRTKWVAVHTDEVYFRDTAHGFLAWAVATLVTAAMLTSVIASILGTAAQAGAAATKTDSASSSDMGMGYFVDALFRKDASASTAPAPAADPGSAASNAEVTRIIAHDIRAGALSPEDARYVGQVVAQRTGMAQSDAEKRVADTFATVQSKLKEAETAAREAADKARKTSAGSALWLFVSLLVGAFVASVAATYGGRRRDY